MLNLNNLVNSLSHYPVFNNSDTSPNVEPMDVESNISLAQEEGIRLNSLPIECLMRIGSFLVDPKTLLNFNIVTMSMKKASIKGEEESARFGPICTDEQKLFLELAGQLIRINKDLTPACNAARHVYDTLCKQLGKPSPYSLKDAEGIDQFFRLKNVGDVYNAKNLFHDDAKSSFSAIKRAYEKRLETIYCSIWEMLIQNMKDKKARSFNAFTYTLIKFLGKLIGFIDHANRNHVSGIDIRQAKIESQSFKNLKSIYTEYTNSRKEAKYKEVPYLVLQLILRSFRNIPPAEITRLFGFSPEEAAELIKGTIKLMGYFPTPLAIALLSKQEGFVRKVLDLGADITERNGNVQPTWHIAATSNSSLENLSLLLKQNLSRPEKLNIDEQDSQGQTALHLAAHASNLAKVQVLLEEGANCEVIISPGNTLLHLLISSTFYESKIWNRPLKDETKEIIRLLMEKSPLDPAVKDQNGSNIKAMADWILRQETRLGKSFK